MRCQCEKPKPTEAAEDTFARVFGVVMWMEGVTFTACATCGRALTDDVRRVEAPPEDVE